MLIFLIFPDVNRKLTHLNAVSPDILVSQIWLQEEPTSVEIIELNTSDELEPSTTDALDTRLNHAWSFTNNEELQQIEDNYKINNKARERRRLNKFQTKNTVTNTSNQFLNNNFNSDIDNQYIEERQLINHQVNCFTMINKNIISSDSSSDADIDLITSVDLAMESNNWKTDKHSCEKEIITYDPELDTETRTIWIYSFKNKQLLAEDDYELNDTPTKDMSFYSTSSSTERDEEKTKDKSTNVSRLGSPIPPAYIPRLNLTMGPTLSTVSEVSEPNKQISPNPSYQSPKPRFQKQRNSWVTSEPEQLDPILSRKFEKSTNVVNWMALSPREKRRISKEQVGDWVQSLLNTEPPSFEKCSQQQTPRVVEQDNGLKLQVDVDVHVSVNEKTPKNRSLGTPNSANITLKSNPDKQSPIALLKYAPTDIKVDALDRGDHMKFGQNQQVLCVGGPHLYETMQFNETFYLRRIGDVTFVEDRSFVEVNPEVWEREQKVEVETASYDYDTEKLKLAKENADRAWMKNNAPFLVPSSWADYADSADRSLSIQMSNHNVETIHVPWYKRFLNSINCFK